MGRHLMMKKAFFIGSEVAKISPSAFDILVTDINDSDLKAISLELNITRLATVESKDFSFPLKGSIFDQNRKNFFPMILSHQNNHVSVPMMLDSGSPYTYLRKDTLKALGIKGEIPVGVKVRIHGHTTLNVYETHAHFHSVDLLGQDYLEKGRIEARYSPSRFKAELVLDVGEDNDSIKLIFKLNRPQ